MHRTRRTYLRPAEHPGPETVMLGGTVRVKRGWTATLHTTDEQHAQLLAEGWQDATEPATAAAEAPAEQAGEIAAQEGEVIPVTGITTANSPRFDAIPRRKRNGEVTNG